MKTTALGLLLGALILPIACGPPAREWQGTIEERDGVVHVSNPAEGMWDGPDGRTVIFVLEQTFGVERTPEDAILNMIGRQAFDVDDDGNVYLFDGGDHRLVSFAPDGEVRWSGGRPGQGPGEFSSAEGMAWNGADIVYVTTEGGARIDSWSTDGEFLDSMSIAHLGAGRGSLVGVLDEHTVVLQESSPNFRAGVRVTVLNLHDDVTVADFEVDISSGPTDSGAHMEVDIVDGRIAIGDWDSYDIRFYNREGVLERIVTRDFEHMVLPASSEERRTRIYARSWLKPPLPLADGMMLASVHWTDPSAMNELRFVPQPPTFEQMTATGRTAFDLFDRDGRFLTSVPEEVVEIGNADEVDREGRVYTVAYDPYPHIRRYRLVIEDER